MTSPNYQYSSNSYCSTYTDFTTVETAEKSAKNKLKDVLKLYGLDCTIETISKIVGYKLSEENLSYINEDEIKECLKKAAEKTGNSDTDALLNLAQEYYARANSGSCDNDQNDLEPCDINTVLKSQLGDDVDLDSLSEQDKKDAIKTYFEAKLKEYDGNEETLKKEFINFLINTPDKDRHLLLPVVLDVFKNADVVAKFFGSFKNKKVAQETADKIVYKKYESLSKSQKEVLLQYKSVAGTGKLISELDQEAKTYYFEHQDVLDRIAGKSDSELTEDEELKIRNEFNALQDDTVLVQAGILNNDNYSEEEKRQLTEQLSTIFKDTPYQESFLEKLAETLSQSDLSAKSKELLDKVTEGKFSEKYNKIPEKSAFDSAKGEFKKQSAEVKAQSEQKIQLLNADIERQSAVEETETEACEELTSEEIVLSSIRDRNHDIIKDIFTGKLNVSDYVQQVAIEHYKLWDIAQQGSLLQSSAGEFFSDLLDKTKKSTLMILLASGWKGRSYDMTQQVKDAVKDRKNGLSWG